MANPGTINASNFFGGDKVEQYRQELVADGRIPGTKQNATPEERKEGLKLYRKNKIEFKTFVENVLKKKSAGGGGLGGPDGTGGGGLRPTRALLPGTRTGAIVKYKPLISEEDLKEPSKTEVSKEQVEQGFDDILDKIDDLLKEVRDTTKFEKAVADKDRKEKEKKKREEKETRLEGLKKVLAGPAQKILAPIKSIFQEIMDAIGQILFAKVGMKLIDWYSDEDNQEKLHRVIKFFREHWLLIVGGLLLFGTRLNGLVMFFLRLGLKYVPKLIGLVAKMLAAAGKLALKLGGGALKMLGKAAPIARAALVSPAAKVIGLGAAAAGAAVLANEVTGQRKAASVQAGNADRARRGKGAGVQGTDTGMDKTSSPGNIPTGTTGMLQGVRGGGLINSGNRTAGPLVTFNPTFAFSSGGAPLGTDTIPAMLSPGEFVMSKGAVQKFGTDTFASMNAAGGGTNKPKLLRGTLYAKGGGVVNPFPEGSYKGQSGQKFGDTRSYGGHVGIDITENPPYKSDAKRPIYAATNGKILSERYQKSGYTSGLMIDHGDGYQTRYLHMTPMRNIGDTVQSGQQIGKLLDLGNQTHLHLEFYQGSKLLNPTNFFLSATKGTYTPGGEVPADIASKGEGVSVSPVSSEISQSQEQNINPIQYMADTYKLYQEVFGTTPSDMQKVNPVIGVPSPQVASATPNSGISNDIPRLGSIDPNNRSTIGMKAMYSIVQ